MSEYLFTSESVAVGHPDKVADQISDAILDAIVTQDPTARVACETLITGDLLVLGGEITTTATVDLGRVARDTIRSIGYTAAAIGLDAETVRVIVNVSQQSPEIYAGVFHSFEEREQQATDPYELQGAGDQGIVFGYANNDNSDFFPAAAKLAHMLTARHANLREAGGSPLRPDAKSQVTLRYVDGKPTAIANVLISTQHDERDLAAVRTYVTEQIIKPVINEYNTAYAAHQPLTDEGFYLINPAGSWHVGGPAADAGLTGRKIIVDSYGGYARHGGGCYSGKDATKTDRSGAYMLRYAAKNLVAAGVADELELQIAYAIGSAHPVSIHVDTRGTNHIPEQRIIEITRAVFDFRPAAIIDQLGLRDFRQWRETAANGHFGRKPETFPWEKLDRVAAIKELLT